MRIAISGLSGCGNSSISSIVAGKMGLKRINYTFRDVAVEEGLSLEQLQQKALKTSDYDLKLDRKLVEYALKNDGVIASRLAVWLDDEKLLKRVGIKDKPVFDFKIWLDASLEVRASRIARREGKTIGKAVEESRLRDEENASRYEKLYGIKMSEYRKINGIIVVDTEEFSSAEKVAEKVCELIKR